MSHFYTPWKRQKTYGYEVLVPDDEKSDGDDENISGGEEG